jgi:hypothetical protein
MFRFITEKQGWKLKRLGSDILNFYAYGLGLGKAKPFRIRHPEYK